MMALFARAFGHSSAAAGATSAAASEATEVEEDRDFILPKDLVSSSKAPRTLANSRFLRLYDAVKEKHFVGEKPGRSFLPAVMDGLGNVVDVPKVANVNPRDRTGVYAARQWEILCQCARGEKPADLNDKHFISAVVAQWTGVGGRGREARSRTEPLFKLLNRALVRDRDEELVHWVPFVRLLNSILTAPQYCPKKDLTVFRGSKLLRTNLAWATTGRIIRSPLYTAASKELSVATFFARDGVILVIRVPRGCRNACPIFRVSKLDDEREVV